MEYNGRRLAKLNLPPSAILEALQEYDRLLAPALEELIPDEHANFQWVRDQLHFCVILTLNNAYYQVREAETQAFYELFRVELESRNLEELLRRFLETLVHVCRADAGRLYMLNEDSSQWVLRAGCPDPQLLSVPNRPGLVKKLSKPRYLNGDPRAADVLLEESWHSRYPSCWSIPLAADGRTAGVMQFGFAKPYEWLPREQELLAAAAERCLMAAEKARLVEDLAQREEQVRRLAEHMLHVEEMERRRISRELHDEAGQSLLCIRLQMELMEQALPESEGELEGEAARGPGPYRANHSGNAPPDRGLKPGGAGATGAGSRPAAAGQPLPEAASACRVKLQLAKMGVLPQQMEVIAYRLLQECFNNIGKHSGATHVNISLASADGRLSWWWTITASDSTSRRLWPSGNPSAYPECGSGLPFWGVSST